MPPLSHGSSASGRFSPGLRYMVLAAFFFSLMALLVKLAGRRLPASEIVFARSLVALCLGYAMLRREGLAPWGRRRGLLLVRGLAGFGGLLCLFYAFTHLPLAEATVIQFTSPAFTALLAAVFLKEHLRRREGIGILLSLAGVVLVAQPSWLFGPAAEKLDVTACLAALGGAVFSAIAYTTIRRIGESEHHLVVVFSFPLVATPASLPLMAAEALWPTPLEAALLLGVGVVTHTAQIFLTKGLQAERAGRAMTMSYLQIVFATLWGLLFFHDYPGAPALAGALLVVAATVLVGRSSPGTAPAHHPEAAPGALPASDLVRDPAPRPPKRSP